MSRNALRAASGLAILILFLTPLAVFAHQTINVGNYALEYGWSDEPVTAGKPNNIVINLSPLGTEHDHNAEAGDGTAMADMSTAMPDSGDMMMNGSISLTAPADGSTVQGDQVDVSVSVQGVDETAEGLHYHLYVDDQMVVMAPIDQPTVTVTGLANGAHTIKVSLAHANHAEMGEPATASITVEGSSATGDLAVTGLNAMDTGTDFMVDVSGLKFEMVYGGQTTALTLQPAPSGAMGEFVAPFTPERAGQYTLRITGKLTGSEGDTDVNVEVQPEEATPDASTTASTPTQTGGSNTTIIIVVAVVAVLVVAVIIGAVVMSWRK